MDLNLYIRYETRHFLDTFNTSFDHDYGSTTQSAENVFGPTALVDHLSYGENEDAINNWIIISGNTHNTNGFLNQILNMTSNGYVDGVLIMGLTSNT